jgi:MFS family permease
MKKRVEKWLKTEFAFIQGNILVLIIASFFTSFSEAIVNPFYSLYLRGLGASPFVIGLMGSLGSAIISLMRLPGGYIADKYGRKKIIFTMTYGISLSYLFYTIAPSWEYILIGLVIGRLSAIYFPAFRALEADSLPPEHRGRGYATISVLPRVFAVFSPTIAGLLVERYGLVPGMRIGFGLLTLCYFISATLRMLLLKETLENPKKIDYGDLGRDFVHSVTSISQTWRGLDKNLRYFIISMLVSTFSGPFHWTFQALYAKDVIGISNLQWGLVGTASLVAGLVAGIPMGRLADKIGKVRSLIIAWIPWFIFVPLFILTRNFNTLLSLFVFNSLGYALFSPAYLALQGDMMPRESRGRIMALFGMLRNLVIIPSSSIAGYLYELNPVYPFIINLILEIGAFLILVLIVKEPERREV